MSWSKRGERREAEQITQVYEYMTGSMSRTGMEMGDMALIVLVKKEKVSKTKGGGGENCSEVLSCKKMKRGD